MRDELNSKISQATKWSSITEVAAKLIAPITNAILARLLVPEAFGVVATLTMVVSFAEIFTDAGFQKYLVQREFSDKKELDESTNVAFWTNLALSLVIWAGIALFATPISNMVGSPGCEMAIIVMCIEIPLLAFSSIQSARYRRSFDFKTLFVVRMTTAFVPLVVTVPLAMIIKSYWALVVGTLVRDMINAVVLSIKSPWKPRLWYSFRKLREMISFSMWTVVENISVWLTNYIGTFIIGGLLSTYYLGLYKTTTSTVGSYMNLIFSATGPVVFAALSRCQDDDVAFRETFLRFQRMASLLVVPLGFGLFVYRELATLILLGDQWLEAAELLGLWSLSSALIVVLSAYNSEAFRSKGRPRLSVLVQTIYLLALIPALMWGAKKGFQTLSFVGPLMRLVIVLISGIVLQIEVKIHIFDVIKNIWPSFLSGMIMAVVGILLRSVFDSVLWEFATIIMCVGVYTACMLLVPAGRKQLEEIPFCNKLLRLKGKSR